MTTQNVDKIYDGNGNQFNIQIDIDRVNNLQTTLNGKAASSHTHACSEITSGTFPTARIADDAITAAKVKDNETLPCNISGTAVKANTIDLGGNDKYIWASSSYSGSGDGQSAIIGTLSITANGIGNWNNIHENLCWLSRHSGSGILSIYVCMPGGTATTGGDPIVQMRNICADTMDSFASPVQCRLKRTQVSSGTCRYEFTFYVNMADYNYCNIYGRLNSPRDAAIQFRTGTNVVNTSDITDAAYGPWFCQARLNYAEYGCRDSSGNWIESTYLKLSGGNMTGNIGYTSGGATSPMIRFRGGSYGHAISIGGGGCTIVGSGEASDAMIPQISSDDESLHLGGDDDVVMYSNLQDGWSSRKTFRAGGDGNFYIPGAYCSNTSGGTLMYWKGNQNITAVPTANNQEWSIDLKPGSYTGTYWHVWTDKDSKNSLLKVETDNGHVSAPYGFYGNLTGNASTATDANYLKYTNTNEINFRNVPASNTNVWFNYRNGDTGNFDTSYNITDYYFGNKNKVTTGVKLHADEFLGKATKATQDANGNNIHTYYGHTIGITNTKTLQLKNSSGTVINAIDLPYVPVVFDQLGSAEGVIYCL